MFCLYVTFSVRVRAAVVDAVGLFILRAKAREYIYTGVCLCVCVSVCDHDN